MVITLIVWLYIFTILTSLGILFNRISLLAIKDKSLLNENSIIQHIFNGFCLCMGLCSLLYFFSNIGFTVHLLIAIPSLISIYVFRNDWKIIISKVKNTAISFNLWQWLLIFIGFISILLATIEEPTNIDTGNYHAQSIKWMNEYKIIPGLGNLLGNLAYNQSNFLVEAFFSFSFLKYGTFRVLNGFLVLVFILNIIKTFNLKNLKFNAIQFIGSIIIIFFFIHYKNWISSPSPDVIITLMTYYIFYEGIKRLTNNPLQETDNTLISIYFIAISALTVKLSAITLPFLAIVLILRTPLFFKQGRVIFYALLTLIIIVPWLVRNVFFSGYLIFPVAEIDLFNVDWKIPRELVIGVKNAIHGFSTNSQMSSVEIMKLTLWDRIIIWINTNYWYRILYLLIILFSQFYFIKLFFSKAKLSYKKTSLILLGFTTFLGVVFWFLTAPDFRFGSALVYMSISTTLIITIPKKVYLNRFFGYSFILLTLFFLFRKMHVEELYNHPLKPAPYPKVEVKINNGKNFRYAIPKNNYQCWDYNLPCVPFGDLSIVKQRGENIEDGFKYDFN